MGRAERRRLARDEAKAEVATYTFTKPQLDALVREKIQGELAKMKKEATEEAVNTAMVLMLTLPLEVLKDHYWKKSCADRIPKFTELVIEYYEKWQNGEIDIETLREDLWNYAGVRLEGE